MATASELAFLAGLARSEDDARALLARGGEQEIEAGYGAVMAVLARYDDRIGLIVLAAALARHVHDMGDRVRTLDSFAAIVAIGSADLDVERAVASWSAGRAQP